MPRPTVEIEKDQSNPSLLDEGVCAEERLVACQALFAFTSKAWSASSFIRREDAILRDN